MANEYLDDYEQEQQVKEWLRENGGAIVMGIALGLGLIFGVRYWLNQQTQNQFNAASAFNQITNAVDDTSAKARYDAYTEQFADSAFAGFAGLNAVAELVEEDNLPEAIGILEKVMATGEPPAVRDIARLRLARLHIAGGEYDKALALTRQTSPEFSALAAQVRGDAHKASGDDSAARAAYQAALDDPMVSAGARNILQMKLDALGGSEGVAS